MSKNIKRYALITIFIAIFMDILGFGMVIPLSPILAREFGADGLQVGWLISIYSILQFLVAPYWGKLSDIIGRKPVFLIGIVGMSVAHVLFAFSTSFTHLFLSRMMAGFFGANVVIAMAYIADVTTPEERSKNLGLIGMAFGLGFTFGPALGFLFIFFGNHAGSLPPFGASFASIGAACVCVVNFFVTLFFLKESRKLNLQLKAPVKSYLSSFKESTLFSRPSLSFIWKSLKDPQLGKILFMSCILWVSIAQIEPVLILLVQDDFAWTKTSAYWGFAYIGFLMVFSQGVLVRRLIPRFGERSINKWGLSFLFIGLVLMGVAPLSVVKISVEIPLAILALGVTLFGVGYSLANTSLSGALSLLSSKENQGSIFGVNQSLSSLARILGPLLGGWFYRDISHESPFFFAGLMGFVALSLAFWVGDRFPVLGRFQQKDKESSLLPDSFFSIDQVQLKGLIEKRIQFYFFQVERIEHESLSSELRFLLSQSEFKTEEEIDQFVQDKDPHQPFVFLCEKGLISKDISEKIRKKGYINAYYVEQGLLGLKES